MGSTTTINPALGTPNKTWKHLADADAAQAVDQAALAYQEWSRTPISERVMPLKKCAQLLRDRKEALAILMAEEMGKPVRQGVAEAEKCAWVCEYYVEQAAAFLEPEMIKTEAQKSYISYEPLGVVLAIMPWNFPLWQFFRFAAPTLTAGNTAILKHAVITSGCSMAIGELMRDAGFPQGVIIPVIISNEQVKAIIHHPAIQGVTLTGSTRAGKSVAVNAGTVLKKTVLELGGSDPYLILDDADIATAAELCATSRLINSGQSCIAAKRFITVKSVQKQFEEAFVELLRKKVVGNPLDQKTDVGPIARSDLRHDLHRQVQESVAAGARCLLGGKIPDGPGWYYPASILTNVRKGMPAFDEELFGPVAAVITADDEEQAIALANDSVFGLGAAVFTKDIKRGEQIARHRLQAGCCFVNDFVKSDPRLPFGGIRESGYGRELGKAGIREFVNIKTVYIK